MSNLDIIYLESDEEIPSIIDKLKKSPKREVRMVVPRSAVVLQSLINLKLLQKKSIELDKDIALVTSDPIGRNLAAQLGLSIYDKAEDAEPIAITRRQPPKNDEVVELQLEEKEGKDGKEPKVPVHHFQEHSIGEKAEAEAEKKESKGEEETAEKVVAPDTDNHRAQVIDAPKIKTKRNRRPLIIFSIAILTFLALAFFLLPRATVTLAVFGEAFSKEVNLDVAVNPDNSNQDIIPGELISSKKEVSDKFDATGEKNIGEKAKGTVNLQNGWSQDAITLASGTRLTKDSKIFETQGDVTIPGASLTLKEGKVVTSPGKKSVAVQATDPGEEYNLSPGKFTILDIDKDKQASVYGESDTTFSGGSNKKVKIVSAADIASAKEKVRQKAEDEVKQDLVKKNEKAKKMLLDSAYEYTNADVAVSVSEGDEAKQLTASVSLEGKAIIFDESAFRKVFISKVEKEIPQDKKLVLSDKDEITTSVTDKKYSDNKMTIKASIATSISPRFEEKDLKKSIKGKKITDAKNFLEEDSRFEEANIEVNPTWFLRRLPSLSRNIKIQVEYKNKD